MNCIFDVLQNKLIDHPKNKNGHHWPKNHCLWKRAYDAKLEVANQSKLLQSPVTLLIVITWKISLESRAATAASFRSVSIRYWSWALVYDIISWSVMYGGDVSTAGTRILGICLSMRSLHRRCMIKSAISTYIFLLALIITAPVCTHHRFALSSLCVLPKVHLEAKVLTLGNSFNPSPQTHTCTNKHKHRSRLCQLSLVQIHIQSASRGLSRNVLHVETARWHRES